jgi:hypothetical protein
MGNSKLANQCHLPSSEPQAASTTCDANILGKVRGDQISAALQTLPPPTHLSPMTAVVLYDVEGIGLVEFSVDRLQARRGKHSHYFWCATRAERVETTDSGEP